MKKFIALLVIVAMLGIYVPMAVMATPYESAVEVEAIPLDEPTEAELQAILDGITFDRLVLTGNFQVPVLIDEVSIRWESSDEWLTIVNHHAEDAEYTTITVNRLRESCADVILTAIIEEGAIKVTRDFAFTVVRREDNDILVNRVIIDDNAEHTKRRALNGDIFSEPWEIIDGDNVITINTARQRVFVEFLVVFEGVATTGLRVYTADNPNLFGNPVYISGTIQPKIANYLSLPVGQFNQYVRLVFPAGVEAVNMIAGYSHPGAGQGTQEDIFDAITPPPAFITTSFTMPAFVFNRPATWSTTRPGVFTITLSDDGTYYRFDITPPAFGTPNNVTINGIIYWAAGTQMPISYPRQHAVLPQPPPSSGGGNWGGGGGGGNNWNRPPVGGMDVPGISDIMPRPPEDEPVETEEWPFSDIADHWARRQITWLYSRGYVTGMGDSTFNPNGAMTREQMAQILVNAFDLARTNNDAPFNDAQPGAWYFNAVSAMYDHEISHGDGLGNYGVGLNITRQDAVVLLYRMLINMDALTEVEATTAEFNDYANIADYAIDAVNLFQTLNIVTGTPAGYFNPTAQITRAEMSVIIYRVLEFLR
ncbi:MAG: S-layer homology domain-containing protein [Oscillospiraceae bacterium]|nr:S-layer homology domain-containing protein [Oscillospiraceae bacterium]